jgi:ABC-type antimicrobial peptide transport system permease subunit
VHDLEPQIPVTVSALKDLAQRDRGLRWAKVSSVGLLGLAGVATLLAILGVYSVLAYGVVRRTREIGIRVSLGGSRSSILGTVLWGGMRMTGVGVLVGVGLSLATASLVRGALVGVSPTGPWALMVVVAIMVATSVLASALPAWRAVRVDPLVALREE